MLRKTLLLILILLFPLLVSAKVKVQGYASKGMAITTSGTASTDKALRVFPLATVTIYQAGTTNLASTWADSGGSVVKANPFVADSTGYWFAYVDAAHLDIKITPVGGSPTSFTIGDVVVVDGLCANASTSSAGCVQLATDGEAAAGKAVQGSDSRLANSRTPSGLAGGDLQGPYPNPAVKTPVITNGATLEGYGDSIEANFNASPSSNGYANLVSAQVGWTITNHGVAGSQCGDQAAVIYTKSVGLAVNENYLLHDGIGDEIHYAADTNKQSVFQACYLAQLYWLAIPDTLKLKASNVAITYTGAWAAATIPYDAKFTYVTGATAQATVVGNAVYVGSLVQTGITAANYTVNVDGTDYGTYDTGPPGGVNVTTSGFNLAFFPVLRRVSLPTFGTHVVTVTATTASFGHPVYLTHIAGNGGLAGVPVLNASLPSVYALTILRQSAAGYVTYGGSDARVAIYNQMIQDDAALVRQDGFNVALFDLAYTINPETDLDDDLHPNNAGHLKIANSLISRMRRSPFVNPIAGSDSFDFTALAANTCEVLTSVKPIGASVGDVVNIGLPDSLASESNRTVFTAWISAASTLSVRRCNVTGTITTNPAPATINFEVRKF